MTLTDSGTGLSATLDRLASAQKTAKGAPAYSRFVNRRAGRYLAALAFQLGMTPNQVTAVSAVFTFSGIVTIAVGRPTALTAAVICLALVLGYALDSADGQLARLRGGGSRSGEWLDHVVDSVKTSAIHLAVLVAAFRYFDLPHPAWLLVPAGFQALSAVLFFAMILTDQLRRAAGTAPTADARVSTLRSLLVLPTDYGVFCLTFLLWPLPHAFFAAYVVLFGGTLLFVLAALPKWFRELAHTGQTPRHKAPLQNGADERAGREPIRST